MSSLPIWVYPYLIVSGLAFGAYGIDKRRAERGGRRVPELWLHLLELLGGFPGAFVAQQVFRHKRRKARYLVVFWLITSLHIGVGVWFVLRASP